MKKLINYLPILLIPILFSCGGDATTDSDLANNKESMDDSKAKSEFADIKELSSKTEFSTTEFTRLTTFLNDKEAIITGYPYAYPLGEGEEVEFKPNSSAMLDGIDNSVDNCSITIKFKNETEPRTMHIGELFAVKGKLEVSYSVSNDERWPNTTRIKITDAEFVDGAEAKAGTLSSFGDLDFGQQIFCGDLYSLIHNHYEALAKKSVVIAGKHYGTTVSKGTDGSILEVRVDLKGGDDKVGCELADETETGVSNAKGLSGDLKIEGKFSGITFGNARISGGVIK